MSKKFSFKNIIVVIQLYLLAPFWIPFAKERWKPLLIIAVLIQIPILFSHYIGILKIPVDSYKSIIRFFREWYLLDYGFWCILGAIVGFHQGEYKQLLNRFKPVLLFALVVSFIACIIEWEILRYYSGREWLPLQTLLSNKIFALVLLLFYFSIEKLRLPFSPHLVKLAPKSYGIYLIHVFVLVYTARIIYHVAPKLLGFQLVLLSLLAVVGISIPVLMMWIVNRTPRARFLYKYLFG